MRTDQRDLQGAERMDSSGSFVHTAGHLACIQQAPAARQAGCPFPVLQQALLR